MPLPTTSTPLTTIEVIIKVVVEIVEVIMEVEDNNLIVIG